MDNVISSAGLLFFLLNPFLMVIYLLDLIEDMTSTEFALALVKGTAISAAVFIVFAWVGDTIFTDVLHARFSAFLIFGGVVFLVIGIRFVFGGASVLRGLRGGSKESAAGSIAMPFMIGPGTVGAAILAGGNIESKWLAAFSIVLALLGTVLSVLALKYLHDFVRARNEKMVERYIDVVGRISALIIGTFSINMILSGLELWLENSTVLKALFAQ